MDLNLKSMEYFVSVAETRSFAASADKLFVSKSALSRGIASLEDELGCALFTRSVGGTLLTEEGRDLLIHARNIIDEYRLMSAEIEEHNKNPSGILKLGFNGDMSTNLLFLRMALSVIESDYPYVNLVSMSYSADELKEQLDSGILDVIMIERWIAESLNNVKIRTAFADSMSVMLNEKHHLARRPYIDFGELAGEKLLIYTREKDADFFEYVSELAKSCGMPAEFETYDFSELKIRASLGEGAALLPFLDKNLDYSLPELVTVPIRRDNDDFDCVIVRKNQNRSKCCDVLFDIIDMDKIREIPPGGGYMED